MVSVKDISDTILNSIGYKKHPFMYSLLGTKKKIHNGSFLALVEYNKFGEIVVSINSELHKEDLEYLLLHEAAHITLKHGNRMKGFAKKYGYDIDNGNIFYRLNIAADFAVYSALSFKDIYPRAAIGVKEPSCYDYKDHDTFENYALKVINDKRFSSKDIFDLYKISNENRFIPIKTGLEETNIKSVTNIRNKISSAISYWCNNTIKYMPHMTAHKKSKRFDTQGALTINTKTKNVAIGIDVSGSMVNSDIIFSVISNIKKIPINADIFLFNDKIIKEFKSINDIKEIELGGDTDIKEFVKKADDKKYSGVIVVTDGFIEYNRKIPLNNKNWLWVIAGNRHMKWGREVQL